MDKFDEYYDIISHIQDLQHEIRLMEISRKLEFQEELDFEDCDYIAGNGKIVEDNIVMFADRFFRLLDDGIEEVHHIIHPKTEAEWVAV